MSGTLYGLGIGPGDPELITVKALRLLRAAQVVAYPAPETGEIQGRAREAGNYEFGVHVSDGLGREAEQTLTITVNPLPDRSGDQPPPWAASSSRRISPTLSPMNSWVAEL